MSNPCRTAISLAARAASNPVFVNSLVSLADGNLVPVPGGVLIRDDEAH